MTRAADRIFENADGHVLGSTDETFEALAVRDGKIVRTGTDYEVGFLEGVGTDVIDCRGGTLLPGFIDAHTHLEMLGRRLVHADLSSALTREEALERLREEADDAPVFGYGYDESRWPERGDLTRAKLDGVSVEHPVVAFREDLHAVSVNSVAFERYEGIPASAIEYENGEPTGVLTEAAVEFLLAESAPDREGMKRLLEAACEYAHERGVTGVHDMVRRSNAPAAYRELVREGALDLRVRLYYWIDHLDAIEELGLIGNDGNDYVELGGIKTYTDGSLGAGTAKLSEPYADRGGTGEWIVAPDELADVVERIDELGFQLAAHAIGDEAVFETIETLPSDPGRRHRIEHAELLPVDLSTFDAVASMQPNFLRWAREDGLYETRLGEERTAASNRFSDVLDADIPLAFGSDCMPLGPLYGIEQAVTAPQDGQRLAVTEALRAYTSGAAYAGHDEDRFGTAAVRTCADLVVLEDSPWEVEREAIADIDVSMTVVGGDVVYERPARS